VAVALLTNPAAGHGRGARAAQRAAARLVERGADVQELVAADAGIAAELAQKVVADGVDALVVVGGDGLINLVLPAVVGTSTPLSVIPAGTGNDQARVHGWPHRDPARAADIVLDGVVRHVDVGEVTNADGSTRLFGSVLAAGFDSLVSDRTNRMRWPHGRLRYDLALLAEYARLRPLPFRITVDGGRVIEKDILLVAVGNTRTYGGGMPIAPEADPADGTFDVTVIDAVTRRYFLRQLPKFYRGTHPRLPEVEVIRTTALRLESPGLNAYADGEYLGALPVDVRIRPGVLPLLVPA
jgi:diacylglycerol kinase (ATP)